MAFVSLLALEDDPQQWLHMDDQEMQRVVNSVKDDNLKMTLSFGIGMHHAGLQHYERSLVEKVSFYKWVIQDMSIVKLKIVNILRTSF